MKYTNNKNNISDILKVYIINSITKSYILNIKIRPRVTEVRIRIKRVGGTTWNREYPRLTISRSVIAGTDPGFQVRGAHLKKLRRAEGGANIFGVFRVKNHDFTPKNHIFSNCGGGREHVWGISCEKS